jgi:UDP-N-acetylmuramoylalanine--D-glutamate ligase
VRFSELEGASVGVWGAGREIGSFARQLALRIPSARIAAAVFDAPPGAEEIAALGSADVVTGPPEQAGRLLGECDVVVRSPGVSIHRRELAALIAAGKPVTTATGLWLAEREGRGVIGVTGTKGKSTTAALIAHLLRAGGIPAALAGNIGAPALDLLDGDQDAPAVVELSSYQIADLPHGPEVALLTNLYREHIDWHGSEQAYRAEKLRLFELPGVRVRVLNARTDGLAPAPTGSRTLRFGEPGGWDVRAGALTLAGAEQVQLAELPLAGEHNALNLCAALSALEAFGAQAPSLPGALAGFAALPHRLETVHEQDGVTWVDDSISTTPESTMAALASFPGRELILIAGGQDRGQDFGGLAADLTARGTTVIAVPSTGPRLLAELIREGARGERALTAADLAEAVALARAHARAGSVVLLSPAAPSYDHFRDFEQRGERFRALAAAARPESQPDRGG